MKKFEYKKVKFNSFFFEGAQLALEGQDGWELVCFNLYITDNYAYFKREIVEEDSSKHPMSNAL